MEIILREDVPKLGHAGDVVRVKDGLIRYVRRAGRRTPRGLTIG